MKNNIIFSITILLVLISILYGISLSQKTKQTISINSSKNLKSFKKISYYKKENLTRYLSYQEENKNLSVDQIITDVNIGLDTPYYTNPKKVKNLNSTSILVNKYNFLPNDYVPKNLETINEKYARKGMLLVKEAKTAFEEMAEAASKNNLQIVGMSSYRSYKYQNSLYKKYISIDGQKLADTYSARPGHSEHQTGLAVDVYNIELPYTRFEETKEFLWMKENAYKYGFILRYAKDKVKQTGYQYESWHYRYVGKKVAKYIQKHNITFDEYYIKNLDK